MREDVSWLRATLESALQKLGGAQERSEPPPCTPERQAAELYWTANGGETHHEQAQICSASANGMDILVSRPLPIGLEVKIALEEGQPIPGWVRYCTPGDDGYRVELFILRPERRRFEHTPEYEPARLEWFVPASRELSSDVIVRNSTPDGVQVELAREVPVPSLVRLCRGDWRQLGLTRYCNPVSGKYHVGIEFTHPPYHKDAADFQN